MFPGVPHELACVDQQTKFKHHAQQLAALAGNALEGRTTVRGEIDNPQKYEVVAERLYENLTAAPEAANFKRAGVEHGFNVCARIAEHGVRAYGPYLRKTQTPGSAGALGNILLDSYAPAVTTFSSLSHHANKMYEFVFDLISSTTMAENRTNFAIGTEEDNDALKLMPLSNLLREAKMEAWRLDTREHTLTERCPASGIMLKKVWTATVRACVANEHLFVADIAAINQSLTPQPQDIA